MAKSKEHDDGGLQPTTFKFSDKVKFALRLVANQRGTSSAGLLQKVILELADQTKVGGKHWLELYDHSPAMAELNLLACPDYVVDDTETELRRFTVAHRIYWYVDEECTIPKRSFVEALWDHRKDLLRLWRETRASDHGAASEAMSKLLKKAGLEPPKHK
jgi:hypothetical protein